MVDATQRASTARVVVRRHLREGDLAALVGFQATRYAAEYGLGGSFEADVERELGRARDRGWPQRGGVWLAERGGELAGSLALVEREPRVAWIRWFLLDPALRGQGIGRRLFDELIAEADAAGYRRVRLETFSKLRTAAHLYRSHGFAITESSRDTRWGPELVFQHYERRRS
jgi:GNAT superfamily N-acetyltransferase